MKIFEAIGRSILFGCLFIIGLNILVHSETYINDWEYTLSNLSLSAYKVIIVQIFGGSILMLSLMSFLFTDKMFDLALLFVLVVSSSAVYNPFNEELGEKQTINLALIASLLIQVKTKKKTVIVLKKEASIRDLS